jgi:NAD(P)-dependent dehydrogenase (short-subunit alcohol dehydrogenase family)
MTTDFARRTALITGAGRGIGRALALELAGAGAGPILVARSAGQLAETRDLAIGRGALPEQVTMVAADLADEEQRTHAAATALAAGRIDILINNAATVEPLGATVLVPLARLRQALELNVIAVAGLVAAVLPGMLDAGWGRIVNVSSSIVAQPGGMIRGNAYATTKAALEAYTVNLAAELAGTGGHDQRLPPRRRGHRYASLDPRAGSRAHRRLFARAVQPDVRRGQPDHAGPVSGRPHGAPVGRRDGRHLGRQRRACPVAGGRRRGQYPHARADGCDIAVRRPLASRDPGWAK